MLLDIALAPFLAITTSAAPAPRTNTTSTTRDLILCKSRSLTDCVQVTIQLNKCYNINFDVRCLILPANTQCYVSEAHNNCDTFNKTTSQHDGNTGYAGVPAREKRFDVKKWSGNIKSLMCYEAPKRMGIGWSYVSYESKVA